LLKSPIIQSEKKSRIITEIFSKALNPITMAYMLIMIRKRRESFIPEIAKQFVEEYKEFKNILTVHFASPEKPDAENRKLVLELMKNYTKANVELVEDIDKELIGGFVLSWHDKQYDASISREIEDMRRAMAKVNLYLKGF
jgi:F-type H+-transporting ATPase subunit delta